jgi:hypothetical protein
MIEYILKLMEEIEKEKPLSYEHACDGRYSWPERWYFLKERLEKLRGEEIH